VSGGQTVIATQHDEERHEPRQDRARDLLERDVGDARHHEQHDADRRMDRAEDQVEDHDQPNCTGSMPKPIAAGTRIGIRISSAASALHEAADDEQDQRSTRAGTRAADGSRDHRRRDGLRNARDRHAPAERAAAITSTATMPVVSAVLIEDRGRSFTAACDRRRSPGRARRGRRPPPLPSA
jgi:hypothetical protein